MVTASKNITSLPLIGSKVIRGRAFEGSIWSVKGSSDPRSDAKPDSDCIQSSWAPGQTHVRLIQGGFVDD